MNLKKTIFILGILSAFFISIRDVSAATSTPDLEITPTATVIWPQIKAASAIVYDPISSKVLYEKNADSVRHIASLAKLMTASVADTVLHWNAKINTKPILIKKGLETDAADKTLKNGTLWNPSDLISYMLIGSSNKASEVISSSLVHRNVFLSLMNHQAKQWGLTHTSFSNPSGLTEKKNGVETPGASSSAREVALMMWHIIENHPNLLDSTRIKEASFNTKSGSTVVVKNTNTILSDLPIIFGKTGFTDLAGGNLAVVVQKNTSSHPYVIVVLGSTLSDRFTDVQALASTSQKILTFQH